MLAMTSLPEEDPGKGRLWPPGPGRQGGLLGDDALRMGQLRPTKPGVVPRLWRAVLSAVAVLHSPEPGPTAPLLEARPGAEEQRQKAEAGAQAQRWDARPGVDAGRRDAGPGEASPVE